MDFVKFHNQSKDTEDTLLLPKSILYDDAATIFAASCAIVFSVVGVLGNLTTIIALVLNPKLRSHATTSFVLSLCISDLLFCAFSLPLTAVRFINKAWTMGETLCKVFPVIFYSNVAFSLLSMVCITLNRYILIAYNSLYSRIYRPLSIGAQLGFIWLFSFSIMLPPLFGVWGQTGLDEQTFSCTILKKDGRSIKKFLFFVGFCLPCVVIICSYTCIYWTVRRQRQKLNQHFESIHHETIKYQHTSTAKKHKKSSRDRDDSRLTAMMLTIFLCFLACFLPLTLMNVADDQNRYPWVQIFASVLAWASSVINPFVYAASNRTYRIAYYKLFAVLKFWGDPLPLVVTSRSYQPSRESGGGVGGVGTATNIHKEHLPTASSANKSPHHPYGSGTTAKNSAGLGILLDRLAVDDAGPASATSSLGDNGLLT